MRALDGAGGRTQISAGGGISPRWSPEGTTIYYATVESSALTAAAVSTGGGFRVTSRTEARVAPGDLNGTREINWDLGPGDEFVYISRGGGDGGAPRFVWILNWPEIVSGMTGR